MPFHKLAVYICMFTVSLCWIYLPLVKRKKIVLMKLLCYLEFYNKAVSEYSSKYAWFACYSSSWWRWAERVLVGSWIIKKNFLRYSGNLMGILPVDFMVNKRWRFPQRTGLDSVSSFSPPKMALSSKYIFKHHIFTPVFESFSLPHTSKLPYIYLFHTWMHGSFIS